MTKLQDVDKDPIIGHSEDGFWSFAYSDLLSVTQGENIAFVELFKTDGRYNWEAIDSNHETFASGRSATPDIAMRQAQIALGI